MVLAPRSANCRSRDNRKVISVMDTSIPQNLTQCAFNFDELNSQPVEELVYSPLVSQDTDRKQCTKCNTWYDPPFTQFFYTDKWKKDGLKTRCKTCEDSQQKGRLSETEARERRKASQKAHIAKPEVQERRKAYKKEYRSRPGVREHEQARQKAYLEQPGIKEHRRANRKIYQDRPEIQEKLQAYGADYRSRPEIQKREQARRKVYRSDPKTQERERAERKEYYSRPEVKDKYRVHSLHRRALKKSIGGSHTPEQIQDQLRRQTGKCYYCRTRLNSVEGKCIYQIEHTFPISRVAGTDIPANSIDYIVLACPTCNMSKSDRFPWEFPEGGRLL